MKETLIRSTLRERIEKDIINRKEQMRNMSYADKEQMRNIAFAERDKRMQLINQLDYEKGIEWFNRGVSLEEIPENYKTNKYFRNNGKIRKLINYQKNQVQSASAILQYYISVEVKF